jgi:putative adenylate-forming enzyme
MDITMLARVLWWRRVLRGRERWSRAQVQDRQRRELARLRHHATAHSPFYQRFHQGLETAPLAELPVLTKATLLEHFDEVTTDPALRLDDLEAYLAGLAGDERFADRYWVASTSGSSGRKAIIPSNAHEWAMILASYARANQWAGINAGLRHRVRMAVVSSTAPWHQSARVAATLRSPLVDAHRLDAAAPLAQTVTRLNELQPQVLVGYASMLRMLAEEQLAGRLQLAPQAVNSASEPLTAEGRALVQQAWHVPPFDVYAATETGGIAAECERHTGMHLFEDLVLAEVADADGRPVPPGVTGDRLLVTVLFGRTLPLIRYELTDRVRLATRSCPCGRPFRLLAVVEGRTDDLLQLPGRGGLLRPVHPVLFDRALALADAGGWQVRQDPDGLTVLVASPGPAFDAPAVQQAVAAGLKDAQVAPLAVRVVVVDAIPAGAAGKRPLIVALPAGTPAPRHPGVEV